VSRLVDARWYELRRAQSTKPATYACPFCPRKLPAFSEHVLIRPEGHGDGRRHAHLACVQRARAAGRLPTLDEWRATQPRPRRGLLARLLGLRGRGG
jgi:hypothetical protein